ncbi:MAG: hypothetical protein ACKV2Q_32640 [Planctomycetaceae bacterium]
MRLCQTGHEAHSVSADNFVRSGAAQAEFPASLRATKALNCATTDESNPFARNRRTAKPDPAAHNGHVEEGGTLAARFAIVKSVGDSIFDSKRL